MITLIAFIVVALIFQALLDIAIAAWIITKDDPKDLHE